MAREARPEVLEKELPHNGEAERAILGAILLHNGVMDQAGELLVESDFYHDSNRRIFRKMILLSESGSPIDLITLSDELRKSADFERVGGATYISSLIDGVPRTDSVVPYARIVTEKSLRRKLILASNQVEALAMGEDEQVGSVIETAERLFNSVRERQPSEPRPLVNAEERHLVERAEPIIPGVVYRRKITSFWGAPGSAKTHLAIDIASTIAQAHNVVYVAGEAVEEMGPRLDAWRAHHKRSLERLWLWREPVMLFERGSVHRFVREICHVQPVLVVLDPLAEMFAGGNENETADMTVAIKSVNLIRSTLGCAMLVVHHSGWTDRHERGSSVLRAAVRLSFSVSRTEERIKLVAEKCSAGRAIDDRYFQILELRTESVDGADPSREGEYTVAIPARKLALEIGPLTKRQKQMIEALALEVFTTGAKFSDLVDHLGIAKSTANNNLSALIKRTLVTRKDNIYRLTSAGHNVVSGFEDDSEVLAEAGPNSDLYWPLCVTK